ncbi:hypothetical protein HKX48_004179 [Thoreauomyces humboldtii]|nr:hypothetical protein HKX48_004179 [Thoreauomyces humboldtii]
MWKNVMSPFVKLSSEEKPLLPPAPETLAKDDVRLSDVDPALPAAERSPSNDPGGPPPTEGSTPKPASSVAAVASHVADKPTSNPLQAAGQAVASHLPFGRSQADASSKESGHPSASSGDSLPATKYRRTNVVLPSYEPELMSDNTVVPESSPKWFLNRILATATRLAPRREDPRRTTTILDKLIRSPHTVRRVVVIGVHGWFPGKFLQRVVGEPTGTSDRFAEKMSMAVRAFFSEKYNITLDDDAITQMPLEGEGKVERRVEILYRQLVESNHGWKAKLVDADMVFVAAHSQGTPVSTMLLSRLIKVGLVEPSRQKIAFLAMAGITHGPYPALKSSMIVKYFEADAARELFEFNDSSAEISKKYHIAMRHILSHGVRLVAIGSWYDQVVPLYSAVMHGFNHPNIYRALYVNSQDWTHDFFSHLVVFGLKLRNAGLADHDLIVHLSDIITGNVYGFGTQGHSAIYEEMNTYMLAVAWAMGNKPPWQIVAAPRAPWTSNMMAARSFHAPTRLNPYFLPWIMARLVDDPRVKAHETLSVELDDLLKMFELWDPQSKNLKEIRFRLEPLRARL